MMGDTTLSDSAYAACVAGVRAVARHGLKAREVEAGTKRAAFSRQHHRTNRIIGCQPIPGFDQGVEHRAVEGVHLVGSGEPYVGHSILDRNLQTIHHCTSKTTRWRC